MPTTTRNLYDVLEERGLIAQSTDPQIRQRLEPERGPVVGYCGFDPTADSLGVHHLVPILALAHFQQAGHKPLIVIGGATALVGDPSGKIESRKMLSREQVEHNAQRIAQQIGRIVRFDDSPTGALMLNNADWLADKTWIDMLREVGPHFSVNRMLSMESVKGRLEAGGISFLEFNYMVMQAYDFVHLHRAHDCTVQFGGQDQWGNIVMGIELARRLGVNETGQGPGTSGLAGLTFPLITKADGSKFGKSEAGAVWLDAKKTPPYELFQFFRNVSDADVGRFLSYFTFLPMQRVNELAAKQGADLNEAKEVLAYEMTRLIHGQDPADHALASARKAFSNERDVTGQAIPHAELDPAELDAGVGLLKLMTAAGLAASNSEARRMVTGGGVRLHDDKITDPAHTLTPADIRDGYILIRVGKKKLFRYDIRH